MSGYPVRATSGFTLLEVLIAVAISATIAISSIQLLSNVSNTARSSSYKADELAGLQRFNQIVSRDMEQFINRPIRNEYGDALEALLLDSGDYPLELTHAGWRNSPVSTDPRAELQRVAYRPEPLEDEICEPALKRLARAAEIDPEDYDTGNLYCLVRYYWTVLDRTTDSEPTAQILLDQILDVGFLLITSTPSGVEGVPQVLNQQDIWPPVSPLGQGERLAAIRWRIELPVEGEVTRLWLLTDDGGLM